MTVISFGVNGQMVTGFLNLKKGKIHYKYQGEGSPIFFLNGGPGISSEQYEFIFDKLDSIGMIILFDQRGTGQSTGFGNNGFELNIKRMVFDLEQLRLHLGLQKINLIGQSFGASYALAYAAKYPENVNKMVLISTGGIGGKDIENFQDMYRGNTSDIASDQMEIVQQILDNYAKETNKAPKEVSYALRHPARRYIYSIQNLPSAIDWLNRIQIESNAAREYIYFSLRKMNIERKLRKVESKTVIFHGMSDFINLSVPIKINKLLKNSELRIFEKCGHMIWLDKSEEIEEGIRDFFNDRS